MGYASKDSKTCGGSSALGLSSAPREKQEASVAGGWPERGPRGAREKWQALAALLRIFIFILRETGSHRMVFNVIRCAF